MSETTEAAMEVADEPLAVRRLEGRAGPWWFAGGAVLTFVVWQVLVTLLVIGLLAFGYGGAVEMLVGQYNWIDIAPEQDLAALGAVSILLSSLVILLLVNWAVVRILHGRSLGSVMTSRPLFSFKLACQGFLSFLAIMVVISVLASLAGLDGEVEFVFDAERFWPFLLVVLALAPLQCLAEEVFVRGYLYQGVASVTRNAVVRILLPSLVFVSLHALNPDFAAGGVWAFLSYLVMGVYLALLTVRTAGIEAAVGVHFANNLLAFTVTTSSGAGMPFATIFYDPSPDYRSGLLVLLAVAAIHYMFFRRFVRNGA